MKKVFLIFGLVLHANMVSAQVTSDPILTHLDRRISILHKMAQNGEVDAAFGLREEQRLQNERQAHLAMLRRSRQGADDLRAQQMENAEIQHRINARRKAAHN